MLWFIRQDGKVECSAFPRTVVRAHTWGTSVSERPPKPNMDVLLHPQSGVQTDKVLNKLRYCGARHAVNAHRTGSGGTYETGAKRIHSRRVRAAARVRPEQPVRLVVMCY